jgi:hypothetical protein
MKAKEQNNAFNLLYPEFKKDLFTNNENAISQYLNNENFLNHFRLYKNHILLLTITNSPRDDIFISLLEKNIISMNDLLEVNPDNKKNIIISLISQKKLKLLTAILEKFSDLISLPILDKNILSHAFSHYDNDIVSFLEGKFKNYNKFINLNSIFHHIVERPEHIHFFVQYHVQHQQHLDNKNLPISLFQDEYKKSFNTFHPYLVEHKNILFSHQNLSLVADYVYNCVRYKKKKAINEIFPLLNVEEKETFFEQYGFETAKNKWFYEFSLKNTELFKINNIFFSYKLYEHTDIIYSLMKSNVHQMQKENYYHQSFLSSWLTESYYQNSNTTYFNLESYHNIIKEFPLELGDNFVAHFINKYALFFNLYQEEANNVIFNSLNHYLSNIDDLSKEKQLTHAISFWINQYLIENHELDDKKKQFRYDYLDFIAKEYSQFKSNPFHCFSNLPKKIAKSGDIQLFKIILKYNPEFTFNDKHSHTNFNIIKSSKHIELKNFVKIILEKDKLNQLLTSDNKEHISVKKKMKV